MIIVPSLDINTKEWCREDTAYKLPFVYLYINSFQDIDQLHGCKSINQGENIKALVLMYIIIRNQLMVDLRMTIAYSPAQTINQSTNIY